MLIYQLSFSGRSNQISVLETVEKLAEIFNTSSEILKGRDDGLEEIVSLLKQYNLSELQKEEIKDLIKEYIKNNYPC